MGKYCNYNGCNELADSDSLYCEVHQITIVEQQKQIVEQQEQDFVEALERRIDMSQIIISTGDINEKYKILDTIMVLGSDVAGWIKGANPNQAFEMVKEQMRSIAVEKGGNAVINCQFQFRYAVDTKMLIMAQAFELYGYGTVVRIDSGDV